MYKKILTAVDGSSHGDAVLEAVASLAKLTGAAVHVIHIRPSQIIADGLTGGTVVQVEESAESRLVVDALEMAGQRRLPYEGLLAHSDRGSQYASAHYQLLLARHGIACSMSRRADCWDNAPMESFFASLKKELIHGPSEKLH